MTYSNKRILITGISGFIGSHLADYLLHNGAEVYGLVRKQANGLMPYSLSTLEISDKIYLIEADLQNLASIANTLSEIDPDVIYHFGAQSFIPRSIEEPLETIRSNCDGTANLLDIIRIEDLDPIIVFSGSSEEYGLAFSSLDQYKKEVAKYGAIFPEPQEIPELPINERNPLRPMSPYAVSKVFGDYLARNYWQSYGIKTVVSRAFNVEGAGRGLRYVTSAIANQVTRLNLGELSSLAIGNANTFRDWSHIEDIIDGFQLLAEKGRYGDVYNQGSMRTNSVMGYALMSLAEAGYHINRIETINGNKVVNDPLDIDSSAIFGLSFEKSLIDDLMLREELTFAPEDKGVIVHTDSGEIKILFDPQKFRPTDVPITLSDTKKIQSIGFRVKHKLKDLIKDQLNYYNSEQGRREIFENRGFH